jgi:beta-lactam-binding protein with PASTA domain
LIAGIVIAVVVVVCIVAVAIYCAVTSGAKHGKIDPTIYEQDVEFESMSVL